ncbi:MAG TPA: ATP-binding protein [Anaerolineae bacterium]|nr:ATP-binding protein [Anaerolineae bacterium]HPL26713.1 ATP-binding protein [Anaerolineae bacterium]
MKGFTRLRRQLAWKLFLSYLLVAAAGALVLAGTAGLHALLRTQVARLAGAGGANLPWLDDLLQAMADARLAAALAAAAAVGASLAASAFTASRIVGPIRTMMRASQAVAAGDYAQRVAVAGDDELAALAHAFNRMAEALQRAEARRLELVGNVAHELRTPLAGVKATAEGLVDGVLPAAPETYLNVQREAARLERLVCDLEELSRVESGAMALDVQPVALPGLVCAAAARLALQYADKGVTLQVDVPDRLPPVRADSGRLLQVLTNLLGNALQYTPEGGAVTLSARLAGSAVSIAVADSGIGIAPEHLPHLFERFYRVDKSRSRAGGGSGIGLTIARHLVEAHGGRIEAASAGPGLGSTFTFTLPLA